MDEKSKVTKTGDATVNRSAGAGLLLAQILLVFTCWFYPALLHWQNDGLWFQGDAPRHAANGIFWKDFLLSGSLDPVDYALSYYARYPIITPAAYPPAFYILEAIAFTIFQPSPYLAKFLVLIFSLGASMYLLTWIRRWISAEAGWIAALLPLLPGFILYSNAVMLNVPAISASIAALYHTKRWIESPSAEGTNKHFYLAAAFSLLAVLIYLPAGIVVFIIAAFLFAERRWDLLRRAATYIACLICAGILLPWIWIIWNWEPIRTSYVTESNRQILIPEHWIIYAKFLTKITGQYPLVLSIVGILLALFATRRWRKEMIFLLIIFILNYMVLTVLVAREARYGLLFCLPVVCCCGFACVCLSEWIALHVNRLKKSQSIVSAVLGIGLVGIQGSIASNLVIPQIDGIEEVVSYVEELAPNEPVFYEGFHDGIFIFYLQSRDPGFKRRVVVGRKLIYANAMNPLDHYEQFVFSEKDVVRVLKTKGGCRYIVLEIGKWAEIIPAVQLLHGAVKGPQFTLLKSFPITGPNLERIEIYRFNEEPDSIDEVDLVFPALENSPGFRVRPVRP